MIISAYAEKHFIVFDKIQNPRIFLQTFSKLVIEGLFLNLIKCPFEKATANVTLCRKTLSPFLPKFRNKARMTTLTSPNHYHTGHTNQDKKAGQEIEAIRLNRKK